jgi:hypothetical protein
MKLEMGIGLVKGKFNVEQEYLLARKMALIGLMVLLQVFDMVYDPSLGVLVEITILVDLCSKLVK